MLLSEEVLRSAEIDAMERKIETEIDEAFAFARQSPLPERNELENHIFCE